MLDIDTFYAKYDSESGELLGYYEEDIEEDSTYLSLTFDEWQAALAVNANIVVDGVLVYIEPIAAPLTVEEQRLKLKDQRDIYLNAITHDFGDGRIVQVRPEDVGNFQLAISMNVSTDWVMENNTVEMLTINELQAALTSGVTQGTQIYQDYMQSLKALYT